MKANTKAMGDGLRPIPCEVCGKPARVYFDARTRGMEGWGETTPEGLARLLQEHKTIHGYCARHVPERQDAKEGS